MNVRCGTCETTFRVDPGKVPAEGVRARCSVCGNIIAITAGDTFRASRSGDDAATTHTTERPVAARRAAGAATPAASEATAPPGPAAQPRPEPPAPKGPPVPERPKAPVFTPLPAPRSPAPPAPPAPVAPRPAAPRIPPPAAPNPSAPASPPIPSPPPRAPAPPSGPAVRPRPAATPAASRPARPAAPPPPSPRHVEPRPPAGPARPPAGPAPAPAPAPPPPDQAPGRSTTPLRPLNPFLVQDPEQKARRLARALISDLVVYHPDRRQEGLRDGTLRQLFEEEIKKSWEEYVEQVGEELAGRTPHFTEALNEILAGGKKVF